MPPSYLLVDSDFGKPLLLLHHICGRRKNRCCRFWGTILLAIFSYILCCYPWFATLQHHYLLPKAAFSITVSSRGWGNSSHYITTVTITNCSPPRALGSVRIANLKPYCAYHFKGTLQIKQISLSPLGQKMFERRHLELSMFLVNQSSSGDEEQSTTEHLLAGKSFLWIQVASQIL